MIAVSIVNIIGASLPNIVSGHGTYVACTKISCEKQKAPTLGIVGMVHTIISWTNRTQEDTHMVTWEEENVIERKGLKKWEMKGLIATTSSLHTDIIWVRLAWGHYEDKTDLRNVQ